MSPVHRQNGAALLDPPPAPRPAARRANPWEAWDRFLEATPEAGFMQASWWADFRTAIGFEHFGAVLKTPAGVVGGALVQKHLWLPGHCCYYIQDGPVLPDDAGLAAAVYEALLDTLEARRREEPQTVSHLRIEPRWERLPDFVRGLVPPPSGDIYVEPRHTLCIDLRPPEEAILAQMKPKGRYNLGVARRHGVTVTEDNSDRGLEDFLAIYADMAVRQGIDAKPPFYFRALVPRLVARGHGSMYFAEHHGRRLATVLAVAFGRRATYFYGGSLDCARHVMAPCLLHFEIMRRARAAGLEWYDLWGVAPEDEPEHPWWNISVFKRRFGGREVRLVPTLDLVYDQVAYARYVENSQDGAD